MSTAPNMVEHIISRWFGGNRASFARWMNWPLSTAQRRAEAGTFTAQQQSDILEKSDKEGLGIKPVDFFPDRISTSRTHDDRTELEAIQ